MLVLLTILLTTSMLASVQANSLHSIVDTESRLAMATMSIALTCLIENGFDFVGNDISNVPGQPVEYCCAICSATSGCTAFWWTDQNGGTCWLKSKRGIINVNPMVKSAIMTYDYLRPSCLLMSDSDYPGNDLVNFSPAEAGECCGLCRNYAACRAYTWTDQNGGTCWHNSKNGGREYKAGAKSAEAYLVGPYRPPSCTLEYNVDYIDNDIGDKPGAEGGDCCDICRNTQGCVAFTWSNQNGGTCYLKSAKGSTAQKQGVASSLVLANPPPPTTCTLETDVDYIGNDIANKPSAEAGGCCDICRNTQGCVAFTWSTQSGGTCYLKNAKTQTASKSGVISSTVAANPPAPTCTLENDVDYVGNDIGSALSKDPAQCCAICKSTSGCKAFSWSNYQDGTCWLKNNKTTTQTSAGVKSGTI